MNDSRLNPRGNAGAVAGLAGAAAVAAAVGARAAKKAATERRSRSAGPRTVLVTGAASGLGLELTRLFAARGDRVIATDLHENVPDQIPALRGSVTYRKLDVTSDVDWESAAAEIGPVDVLVLNAGIAVGGRIEKVPMSTWHRALDINLLGAVRGCRNFVPLLPDGAQIVITASAAGLVHPLSMATYNATKAAAVALGETLDAELHPRGISTTVICPQFFQSNLVSSLSGDDSEADKFAHTLLTKTKITAAMIAERAMKGIDRRELIVTPDAIASFGWYTKRFVRPLHVKAMRAASKHTDRLK